MPLSTPPVTRKKIHTRTVRCEAFEREDGLWDIEGHLLDVKTHDIENRDRGGYIEAGEAIHRMSLRLTLDLTFMVKDVEAVIDEAPFNMCPRITERYRSLIGHRIEAGWTRLVKQLFSGANGCTHLRELLGPLATTAFQAMYKATKRYSEGGTQDGSGEFALLNSCHTFAETSEVIRDFWPQHYHPPKSEDV